MLAANEDTLLRQFADRIRSAADAGGKLRLRGGGTKDFYGCALSGEAFDTREYSGVVSYEPTELVVTARCGTPLTELEAMLAAEKQMLSFEPPHFGAGATLGGCVAAGLSGPRRAANGPAYGAVRDYVLGCRLMDGRGDALRFGGQVMKNVAGYDVSRLIAGSMGTLGLILEISLKVLPLPVARATLKFAMTESETLARLNELGGRPLPVTATMWHSGELYLRLEGAAAAVDAACVKLGGARLDEGGAALFWQGVREHTGPFFGGPDPLWRLSVASTAGPITLDGTQLIEWGGALRWWKTDADAAAVRKAAKAAGGHATLFRGSERSSGVFAPLDPVLAKLHRNLKAAFDPAGVFDHGRLYPTW